MDKLNVGDRQEGYPLDFLSHFESLTQLTIINRSRTHAIKNIATSTLQSVFEACPQLESFKLDTANLSHQTLNSASINSISSASNGSLHIGNNLKVFDLTAPCISIGHLLNYSTTLELDKLKLCATSEAFDVWVQDCKQNELVTLLHELRATGNIGIRMGVPPRFTDEDRLREVSSATNRIPAQKRLDNFITFITHLCKERKIICELKLDVYGKPMTASPPTHVEVKNGKMVVSHGVELIDRSVAGITKLLSSVFGSCH